MCDLKRNISRAFRIVARIVASIEMKITISMGIAPSRFSTDSRRIRK